LKRGAQREQGTLWAMSKTEIRAFADNHPDAPVRGFVHVPANPSSDGLVLTHGAGSNSQAPLLVAVADAFCEIGITVLRCDLLFRQLRPHGPPPRGSAAGDQQVLRRAVEAMKTKILTEVFASRANSKQPAGRILLGGHSYGGRQASMLAASDSNLADALLLLSYPLHPPKRPEDLRSAHFPNLRTPAFFVHGTRDGFATIAELTAALKLIPARTQLLPIESAGHELLTARNRAHLPAEITKSFEAFA
jgi:uncharacterized protein